jgi:uncharacterized protein (TIGR02145 family)
LCAYNIVKINGQYWLKQNLNVGQVMGDGHPSDDDILEKICYDYHQSGDSETFCNSDGALYEWSEAMMPFGVATTLPDQGICPDGYHVPTDSDFRTLEQGLTGSGNSCNPARNGWDCDGASSELKIGGSTNFTGLLSGSRWMDEATFVDRTSLGRFISATSNGASNYSLGYSSSTALTSRFFNNNNIASAIRCIRN